MKNILFSFLSVLFLFSCKPDGLRKRDADCKVTSINGWSLEYDKEKIIKATRGSSIVEYKYNGNTITETRGTAITTYKIKNEKVQSSESNGNIVTYEYNSDDQLAKITNDTDIESFGYSGESVNSQTIDGGAYPISTFAEMYDICNLSVYQLLRARTFLAFTHFGKSSIHPIKKGDYIGSYTYTIDDKNRIATCDGDYVEDFIPQCKN